MPHVALCPPKKHVSCVIYWLISRAFFGSQKRRDLRNAFESHKAMLRVHLHSHATNPISKTRLKTSRLPQYSQTQSNSLSKRKLFDFFVEWEQMSPLDRYRYLCGPKISLHRHNESNDPSQTTDSPSAVDTKRKAYGFPFPPAPAAIIYVCADTYMYVYAYVFM